MKTVKGMGPISGKTPNAQGAGSDAMGTVLDRTQETSERGDVYGGVEG